MATQHRPQPSMFPQNTPHKHKRLLLRVLLMILYFGAWFADGSVTTSVDSTTGKVLVQWTAPPNNGAPITSYIIEIQDADGDWNTEPVMCNGNNLAVVGLRQCLVPMQTLTGLSFNLTWDTLIQVRVAGVNAKGTAPFSALLTTGARIRTIPQAPAIPFRGEATTEYQVQVNWTALTPGQQTGSSEILSYELYWDNGGSLASATLELVDANLTSYTIQGLVPSSSYTFKIRALNIYGAGPFSTSTVIKSTDRPYVMDPVSTQQTGSNMVLSWLASQTGGEAIDKYQILIYIPDNDAFVEDLTNCDGSKEPWFSQVHCTFDLVYLNTQYNFTYGDTFQGVVRAHNVYGWSEYSKVNSDGGLVLTRPAQMAAPTVDISTTKNSLVVAWNEMALAYETGGSDITSYNLQQYDGTNWNDVVGNTTAYLGLSTPITPASVGTNYQFKVRAKNIFGFGPFSATATLTPVDVPDKMANLTTSIVNTNVLVSWTSPAANGLTIKAYEVKILTSDGVTYSTQTSFCDGTDATIISFHYCFIPINVTRITPFNLTQGSKVIAVARAQNSKGWSAVSDPTYSTVAAVIITEPQQMAAPTRGSNTGPSQVDVRWTAVTVSPANGGATVTSYNLQWDKGTNGATWYHLVGFSPASLSTSLLVTSGVSAGTTYKFRLRASNLMGWGSYSTPFPIKAAKAPPQMSQPATAVDPATGHFKISWAASATNGDTIDQYLIEIESEATSSWVAEAMCDGSSLLIIAVRYCLIPMTVLRDATKYGFTQGDVPKLEYLLITTSDGEIPLLFLCCLALQS